ncbi:unnamed protein product [Cuscuta campestris]|uniref:Peptidase A1 domain-containing protein n=1 Tax=Cuscuta campestris TaxID=132261 RepID=A0A484N7T2_9ASTE|nr:unnamed protein product [Cuscuta campestris]
MFLMTLMRKSFWVSLMHWQRTWRVKGTESLHTSRLKPDKESEADKMLGSEFNLPAAPTSPCMLHSQLTLRCGEVETGLLLDEGGVNGLLGLGHTPLDVTTLLSSQGLIRNSFSMCFAHDGSGRIAFGDKGDSDQRVTPLEGGRESAHYIARVDRVYVNDVVADVGFDAVFDSGTTVTYLAGEAYATVTKIFDSLVKDPRVELIIDTFEYCYAPGANNTPSGIPTLSFKTRGANISVTSPIVPLKGQGVYCLGIANNKINPLNIIGHNFLTGYRIIFDREKFVLGWKPSDCKSKDANTTASNSNASALSGMESILFLFFVYFSYSQIM